MYRFAIRVGAHRGTVSFVEFEFRILDPASGWLGPALGGTDLTFSLVLRQIRLTVHATRPSVRVLVADRQFYMERDADHVELQSAQESDEAFEQAMYRKSALLQQRRRTGG